MSPGVASASCMPGGPRPAEANARPPLFLLKEVLMYEHGMLPGVVSASCMPGEPRPGDASDVRPITQGGSYVWPRCVIEVGLGSVPVPDSEAGERISTTTPIPILGADGVQPHEPYRPKRPTLGAR